MTNPVVPNVVIRNPKARKIARTVLDSITLILGVVVAVDGATPAFDLIPVTTPVLAGLAVLRFAFGLGVDNRNTPTA